MSKYSFKKLIKENIRIIAANYLISLKQKHSKSENLKYSKEMQVYLRNESLKIEDKKLSFRLRNRLVDVKTNFRNKYNNDMHCSLCKVTEESQMHLMECNVILNDSHVEEAVKDISYKDIFSTNQATQRQVVSTWQKILKVKNTKLKNEEHSSSQASPVIYGASCTFSARHWI